MYRYSKHGTRLGRLARPEPVEESAFSFARRNIGPTVPSKPRFLIDSPKRLKIAVSLTKQTTEAVSNRIKTRGSADLIRGAELAAVELAKAGPIGL